eukprot:tig00000319_g24118.t1
MLNLIARACSNRQPHRTLTSAWTPPAAPVETHIVRESNFMITIQTNYKPRSRESSKQKSISDYIKLSHQRSSDAPSLLDKSYHEPDLWSIHSEIEVLSDAEFYKFIRFNMKEENGKYKDDTYANAIIEFACKGVRWADDGALHAHVL